MDPKDTQGPGTDAPAKDTAEDQQTETGRVDDNQAPEANQSTNEGQSPDVNAEDTAEEKLYAGKYKSPEDMEKAYKELNSKYTKESQERAELSRLLYDAFDTPESGKQPLSQDSETGYEDDDEETSPAARQAEDKKDRDIATMKFIMLHGDADPAGMKNVLATDPLVAQIPSYEAKLEYAYLKSQGMTKKQAIAEAEKKGAQTVQAKTAEKEAAKVESAQKAAPIDENAELWKQAREGTPDERRRARNQIIRKGLL